MLKKRWLVEIIGLALFGLIVFLPPIIHGYVYPNIGDDTAVNLGVIERIWAGELGLKTAYLAYMIVGYPLMFLSELLGKSLDVLYLWFSFGALAAVGITVYLVISRLVSRLAGWLALLLSVFSAQGLLYFFYYGQIFNIINIGIILPVLVYFAVRYVEQRKLFQLLILLFLVGLFGSFHTSGIYLPAIAGLATVVYVTYKRLKKQRIEKSVAFVGLGIVVFSAIVFVYFIFLPTVKSLQSYEGFQMVKLFTVLGKGMTIPLGHYALDIVSPTILALLGLTIVYFSDVLKAADRKARLLISILACILTPLGVAAFAKLSLDPWRQAVDFATILALFIAVFVGILLGKRKNQAVMVIVALLIGFGLYHNLPTWFGYNSAIRPVDIEAATYVNNYKTYSVSGTLAYWVYDRFTTSEWQPNDGDIVIVRNLPMTPRSTEGNVWYQAYGCMPSQEYELAKTFGDGVVKIEIYELADWARLSRHQRGQSP